MRIHTSIFSVIILSLLSLNVFGASRNKEMKDLFKKYDEIMNQQRVELVDEVFTKDFLQGHGGKEQFVAKVKTLPYIKPKKGLGLFLQGLKKSKVGKFFSVKTVSDGSHSKEFIIKEEDGKLKIDGTVGDG